jgi:hypothetical protein
MEGTLSWIEQYQLNQTTGEWYATDPAMHAVRHAIVVAR